MIDLVLEGAAAVRRAAIVDLEIDPALRHQILRERLHPLARHLLRGRAAIMFDEPGVALARFEFGRAHPIMQRAAVGRGPRAAGHRAMRGDIGRLGMLRVDAVFRTPTTTPPPRSEEPRA